jgi:hypothetical protein
VHKPGLLLNPTYLGWIVTEGNAMSVVVKPSARETFTPRELTDAYKDFEKRGPQYLDAETGIKAAAYRFASACFSFTRRLRRTWWSLFTQPRTRKGLSEIRIHASRIMPISYSAWEPTAFVMITYTNVSVRNLTSGATFSIRGAFSYTNPLAS